MSKFLAFSHVTSGFVAVLVGLVSSAALVFQAATVAGASPAEVSSWLFGLGMSIAITCIGLSLYFRVPILTGWSTPGAALLVTSLSNTTMSEAIGAFTFAALLTILTGITGFFEKATRLIPRPLSSAMLAGILIHFGMNIFTSMQKQFSLIMVMIITYLLGKRFFPKYIIILVLLISILTAQLQGLFHFEKVHFAFSTPIFTLPTYTLSALISIGLPLFIVTMTSQNIPGIAVLNASGYKPPASPLISWTGVLNALFAPFGCYSICLAAFSAAICASNEADVNPTKRYKATVFAGCCWLLVGLFGATLVTLLVAVPNELILALAGLALLSTIGNSMKNALEEEAYRDPALITILVAASGTSLYGIGPAFWGLIAGIGSALLLNWKKREALQLPSTT